MMLVVLIILVNACPHVWSLSSPEYTALYDLYTQTGGMYWSWVASAGAIWNFTSLAQNDDICMNNWQGIECSSSNCIERKCFVVELSLPKYGLRGTLPTSLKGLSNLVVLDLSNNLLSTHSFIHSFIPHDLLPHS